MDARARTHTLIYTRMNTYTPPRGVSIRCHVAMHFFVRVMSPAISACDIYISAYILLMNLIQNKFIYTEKN